MMTSSTKSLICRTCNTYHSGRVLVVDQDRVQANSFAYEGGGSRTLSKDDVKLYNSYSLAKQVRNNKKL